ncbi:MAG: hypothetical protein JW997_06650, partial [Actinobacteria bacterium]|nr:hypothetical protein [Actinomycetota bacterium]
MTTFKQDNIDHKAENIIWPNQNILDLPVYRVFSIKRLLQIIKTSKNVLVKPELWDDPFENILAKLKGYATKSKMVLDLSSIFGIFYGQCWTLNVDESDALWRIYSLKKDGVRVK